MNYQNFASYNNAPPYYGKERQPFYDKGSGIPPMDDTNMTVQDVFKTPFLFLSDHRQNYKKMVEKNIPKIACGGQLSKIYFSDKNIKRVQKMLRNAVNERTNGQYKVDVDQDMKDVALAMRSVFIEHARPNSNEGLVRQVKRLNSMVVEESVPGMMTNIKQYYGYLKDINSPIKTLPRAQNVNSAGRRILPSFTTTFM